MTNEKYIKKLEGGGDLSEQLCFMADEYLGPCGQSVTIMQANQIKREALIDAVVLINNMRKLADHYENMSKNFMPGDIRGPMMEQAAKDIRERLSR